jgi:hypothetical protein
MPNWCSNSIEIKGDKESIDEFKKFLDEGNGKDWFNFFLPTPPKLMKVGMNGMFKIGVANGTVMHKIGN